MAIISCLYLASAQTNTDAGGNMVYKVGGAVSPPAPIHSPDPEYSKEARHAKYQGTCVLWMVVDTDGRPRDIKVSRTLGLGLDEKAVEAVRKWRFKPAMKDGKPVAVRVSVQVNFHLYGGPRAQPSALPASDANEFEVDSPAHFTQDQLVKLAAGWNTKPSYTQQQLADLRLKCAAYINESLDDLESKRVALPPHECAGVLGWMRTLDVESLYTSEKPPQ